MQVVLDNVISRPMQIWPFEAACSSEAAKTGCFDVHHPLIAACF